MTNYYYSIISNRNSVRIGKSPRPERVSSCHNIRVSGKAAARTAKLAGMVCAVMLYVYQWVGRAICKWVSFVIWSCRTTDNIMKANVLFDKEFGYSLYVKCSDLAYRLVLFCINVNTLLTVMMFFVVYIFLVSYWYFLFITVMIDISLATVAFEDIAF